MNVKDLMVMNLKEIIESINIEDYFRFRIGIEYTESTVKIISLNNETLSTSLLKELLLFNNLKLISIDEYYRYYDEEDSVYRETTMWEFSH